MRVQNSQHKRSSMKFIIFNIVLIQLLKVAAAQQDYGDMDYPEVTESEEPAVILSPPEEYSVEVGGDITFPCEVQHLGTKQLVFQFNSFSTPSKERLYFAGSNRFSTNHRLVRSENGFRLSNIRRSDAGSYACKLYDPPRQVVHKLKVLYPAKIRRISSERQQVVKGDSVTLQCEAEGNPEAHIQWSKKGGRLPSGEHVEEGLSITLANVDRHEAGTYQCSASNGIGKPSAAEMTIEVEFRPEIIIEESILHTGDGDDAKLVCIVHGHPTPEVTWFRGNHLVASDKHLMTHEGEHRHSLIIRQVQEEDFGEYTCTAKNSHGTAESTVSLTGLPKVPRLTSSPSGGEEDSYTLTWETESFSPIVQYRLKYRKYADGTQAKAGNSWNDSLYLPVMPPKHSQQRSSDRLQVMAHAIQHLDPATDYQVLVAVENKFGWSEPSDAMIFHTRKEIADGQSASAASIVASSTIALLFAAMLFRV